MKHFKLSDFNCKETGENEMCSHFLVRLDNLREACGFPFIVNSGYRSPEHSVEKAKSKPGFHAQGLATDIRCRDGNKKRKIVAAAIAMGFNGIGVYPTFIHVDDGIRVRPVIWSKK